jgi:hypothetical protein
VNPDVPDTLLLLWEDRPVCVVRGIGLVNDLGWAGPELVVVYEDVWGGTFTPGTFPKELADAWAWVDAEADEEADGWPETDVMDGWSVKHSDGAVRRVFIGQIDFEQSRVTWGWA